jgi:hypothetical protein
MSLKIGAQEMRNIASMVKDRINDKDVGFVVVTFDFDKQGITNYVSNGKRDDMIKYFRELLSKWESEMPLKTIEEN